MAPKMSKVTVIGGGGTGHTLAADLSRRGYDVSLCELPEYSDSLAAAKAAGGVEVTGALPEGFFNIHSVAPDFDASVANADLILVSVVANRHRDIDRMISVRRVVRAHIRIRLRYRMLIRDGVGYPVQRCRLMRRGRAAESVPG